MRGPFLHIDLYRLTPPQAEALIRTSSDFGGIRCIEWSERVHHPELIASGPVIHIDIRDDLKIGGRQIRCTFHDAPLPTIEQIDEWRRGVLLPKHIIAHCEAVATFAETIGQRLMERGHIVRCAALRRAAEIHDLLRFIDFRPGGHPENNHTDEEMQRWEECRSRYPDMHHERACAQFLREHGFDVIAEIVSAHGLQLPPGADATIEQKLLFYADKRVLIDRIVTLQERFEDFTVRYGQGKQSEEGQRWQRITEDVERELFPEGAPR